jgi:sigma-54 specific flagellar transcriptional regulator A
MANQMVGRVRPIAAESELLAGHLPAGTSPAIQAVNALIQQVAGHESTVLLLGESGTGKEVAARAIHERSARRHRPFVPVNCGAIPSELVESELFGHEKGSFTGAVNARKGRFEIADGGTLFLDEIGDMSPVLQVKLLRVLQERTFDRVGGHTPIPCNVRIIAATHRDLELAIERGAFREDLFHRLNVFPIELPALRSRAEDLPCLIEDFADRNVADGRGHVRFSPQALAALTLYPWPGNIRELANLIERMSIVCAGRTVALEDLPAKYRPERPLSPLTSTAPEPEIPDAGIDLRAHLDTIERQLILHALERSGGTVAQAARLLALRRTTLVEKLRKFGISASLGDLGAAHGKSC